MFNRRSLLTTTCLSFGVLLAGCAGTTVTLSSIVTTATTAITGLANAFTAFTLIDPNAFSSSVVTAITGYFANATQAIDAVSTIASNATIATGLQGVMGYINDGLAVLSIPLVNGLIPPPFNEAISAFDTVAPSIEAFIIANLPTSAAGVSSNEAAAMRVRKLAKVSAPQYADYSTAYDYLAKFSKS